MKKNGYAAMTDSERESLVSLLGCDVREPKIVQFYGEGTKHSEDDRSEEDIPGTGDDSFGAVRPLPV